MFKSKQSIKTRFSSSFPAITGALKGLQLRNQSLLTQMGFGIYTSYLMPFLFNELYTRCSCTWICFTKVQVKILLKILPEQNTWNRMAQREWEGGISNQMLISKLFSPFPQGWPMLENSNQKSMLQVFNYYFFSLTI